MEMKAGDLKVVAEVRVEGEAPQPLPPLLVLTDTAHASPLCLCMCLCLCLLPQSTKAQGIKCGTFGASSLEDRHLATGDYVGSLNVW